MTETTEPDQLDLLEEIPQRILGRLVGVYCKKVRNHSASEKLGIFAQLRRLVKKGLTLHELQTALDNYILNVTAENTDVRLRKNIRSFFTFDNVKAWQKPLQLKRKRDQPRDPALDVMDRFEQQFEVHRG